MKAITELLKRLAELRPGLLQWIDGWYDADTEIEWPEYWEIFIDGCAYPSCEISVQIAIQQAIEAEGWGWSTGFNIATGKHWACILSTNEDVIDPCTDAYIPAHALLAAYVEALEAMAEVA